MELPLSVSNRLHAEDERYEFRALSDVAKDGIIEQVHIRNFMCHSNYTVRFKENINFIIGLNGSGKSTVVTAVIVGLGGRAALTSRGSSLKELVMNGKRIAKVSIKLRNCGADPYCHDVYGDSIVIERKLTVDGTSAYRICNAAGETISNKRDELTNILDYFNIQVDNPIVILNQASSKEFLLSNSANDMYRFFMKATLLEQLWTDYCQAVEAKRISQNGMLEKEEELAMMKLEVQKAKRALDACLSVDRLQDKVDQLKEELAWAYVCEKEHALEVGLKELQTEEARLLKVLEKLDASQKKHDAKKLEESRLQEEAKAATEASSQLEPQHRQQKSKVSTCKKDVKLRLEELRSAETRLRGLVADRDVIQNQIDDICKRGMQDYTAVRQKHLEKIDKLEGDVKDILAQCEQLEASIQCCHEKVASNEETQQALVAEEHNLRQKLSSIDSKLREVKSSQSDELRRFGAWMPELVRRVEEAYKEGKFHEKPRGPVGAHVKLRDGRWAVGVEKCLGSGLLLAFCVNDFHDERVFQQIVSSLGVHDSRPQTITCRFRFQLHNVPQRDLQFSTVLKVLDISDVVVANFLIDQRGIENVLLCDDQELAVDTMLNSPPDGCYEMFTIHGHQLFSRPCFRHYPCARTASARYLSVSTDQVIDSYRQKRKDVTEALQQKLAALSESRADGKRKSEELHSAEEQLHRLRRRHVSMNVELGKMRNTDDPMPASVQTLEAEVEVFQAKIKELEATIETAGVALSTVEKEQKIAEDELRSLEGEMRSAVATADPFHEQLSAVHTDVNRASEELKHHAKKKQELDEKLAKMRQRHEAVRKELDSTVTKVSQISTERVRTLRNPQSIRSEIDAVLRRIDDERRSRGDPDELRRSLAELKLRCLHTHDVITAVQNFLHRLEDMLRERILWFGRMQKNLAFLLNCHFSRYVNMRDNFSAHLEFSHEKNTIDIVVTLSDETDSSTVHSMNSRGLSSGERSFLTTSFVLALWHMMESPFCCLDEFDVFMDLVNRQKCLEMFVKMTKDSNHQFILLTPLDMSELNMCGADVNILEIVAPRDRSSVQSTDTVSTVSDSLE